MRILAGFFTLSVLLVSACGGGSSSDEGSGASSAEARKAILRVALSQEYGDPSATTPPDRDYDCVIHGGGPAPGIEIPGTCRWDAERDGDGWVVSITQTWECSDFSGVVEGYQTCNGEGSHSWRHRVDGKGEITYLGSEGDFPPSYAE